MDIKVMRITRFVASYLSVWGIDIVYFLLGHSTTFLQINELTPHFLFYINVMQESCGKTKNKMKRFIILVACIVYAACATAQTKIAYLDLYQRGGARHLRTTLMFNNTQRWCGKMTLGQALNMLAEDGWVVDKTLIGANRVGAAFFVTRHKFHIILKKEYQQGENPFEKLLTRGGMAQNTPMKNAHIIESDINVKQIKSEMAILSK